VDRARRQARCQARSGAPGLAEWRRTAAPAGPGQLWWLACLQALPRPSARAFAKGFRWQGISASPASHGGPGGVVQPRQRLGAARPCVVWSLRAMTEASAEARRCHERDDEMFAGAIEGPVKPCSAQTDQLVPVAGWAMAVRAETRPAGVEQLGGCRRPSPS